MALDRNTKQLIKPKLQSKHIELCHEYQRCTSKADADLALVALKAWWFSLGACLESSLKELMSWIDFWHFRYEQWGSHISEVYFRALWYLLTVLYFFILDAFDFVVGIYFAQIFCTYFMRIWPYC